MRLRQPLNKILYNVQSTLVTASCRQLSNMNAWVPSATCTNQCNRWSTQWMYSTLHSWVSYKWGQYCTNMFGSPLTLRMHSLRSLFLLYSHNSHSSSWLKRKKMLLLIDCMIAINWLYYCRWLIVWLSLVDCTVCLIDCMIIVDWLYDYRWLIVWLLLIDCVIVIDWLYDCRWLNCMIVINWLYDCRWLIVRFFVDWL
jgi:hypothetical protein